MLCGGMGENKIVFDKNIGIEVTDLAKEIMAKEGYDPVYGARPLKRFLQKHVETLSAKLILADQVGVGDTIVIDVENGELVAKVK